MRENTRCEVDEPISTPTLRTTISSSSTSERPVLEKKMRPPSASPSVMTHCCPGRVQDDHPAGTREPTRTSVSVSRAHEFRYDGALLVEFGLHPARHAFRLELGLVLGADEGVFHPIGDCGAAFGDIHGGGVGVLLAGWSGLAARIVRSEPGSQPQRLLRRAEMLVVPARAARRRRHHADGLVVDALDLVGMAVLPGRDAVAFGPGIGIALALEADQHRRRRVRMRLGIAAVLVLADPEIERVAGHERLDPAPAGRAPVVERQVAIDDVRDEIRAPHGEPTYRVGLNVVLVLVEIVRAAETLPELVRAIEHHLDIVDQVEEVGRGGAGKQQRRRGTGIDDAMPGVDRNREQRTLLPFEHVALAVAVEPDLGRAAAFDHQIDFLVKVSLGVEGTGAGHLDDVAAPLALGAVELDVAALAAQPLPRRQRQVLHLAYADVAVDRDALRLHEQIVGGLRPAELAEARPVVAGGLMPMRPSRQFVHGDAPGAGGEQPPQMLCCQSFTAGAQARQGAGGTQIAKADRYGRRCATDAGTWVARERARGERPRSRGLLTYEPIH